MRRAQQTFQYGDQRMAGATQFRLGTPVITGLVSSRYQSQNWFRVNSYRMPAAISKRKLSSASRYALTVWLNSAGDQRSASDRVISPPLKPQSCSSVFISTKRLAFHSLLQKLR